MKKGIVGILVLFLVACSAIPAQGGVPIPKTDTPIVSPLPFSIVTNTPTVFAPETHTSIPVTETPAPPAGTPIPSATVRVNLPLDPGEPTSLTYIQMIDSQNGWGFDADYHILKTHDGAATWQDITPPTEYYIPAGFYALDSHRAWLTFTRWPYTSPQTAYVWRTDDGGESWTPSQPFSLIEDIAGDYNPSDYYFPIAMQFVDPDTGWLLVSTYSGMNSTRPLLFRTVDGGGTWKLINDHYHDLNNIVSTGLAFFDGHSGWVGQTSIPVKFGWHSVDKIMADGGWHTSRTSDGGNTFPGTTLLPLPEALHLEEFAGDIADCGESRMMTIPPNVAGVEWTCLIYHLDTEKTIRSFALTSDGGKTWNGFPASGNEFFLDGSNGWRLLAPGQLQRTRNGGLDWETIKTVSWENVQFDFIDEQDGWAIASIGEAKALLHTVDGGRSWMDIKPVVAP